MAKSVDPTEAIRKKAGEYAGADEGASCTQASFKVKGKAFLYIGPQGGRFKAMFKLKDSRGEAELLAKKEPDRFEVGSTAWVTARFSSEKPLPKKIWSKWLAESYAQTVPAPKTASKKKAAKKKSTKKSAKKKATKKSTRKST